MSSDGYEVVIPKPVANHLDRIIPYGITEDVRDALQRLADDTSLGQVLLDDDRRQGEGPMIYTFDVLRAPIVFSISVTYRFEQTEKHIILLSAGVNPYEGFDELDADERS